MCFSGFGAEAANRDNPDGYEKADPGCADIEHPSK